MAELDPILVERIPADADSEIMMLNTKGRVMIKPTCARCTICA